MESTFSKNVENRDVGRNRVTMFCVSQAPLEVTEEMGSCQARHSVRNFAAEEKHGGRGGSFHPSNGPKTSKNVKIGNNQIFAVSGGLYIFLKGSNSRSTAPGG